MPLESSPPPTPPTYYITTRFCCPHGQILEIAKSADNHAILLIVTGADGSKAHLPLTPEGARHFTRLLLHPPTERSEQ